MWHVKANVIPVMIRATGTISNYSDKTCATYWESTKSWNYKKQPYWTLHTYFGKY
jgi:hypothetical protein